VKNLESLEFWKTLEFSGILEKSEISPKLAIDYQIAFATIAFFRITMCNLKGRNIYKIFFV